ncbi:histidinol dehydrogenase [Methanothermobacter thermautotrophicus]|uniref:Histidinol dehydrogenase n=1 Tax=Methanothermobacter thermautotrophicus TaxID=145262 RepID=A0A842YLE1_METTF|nr:histidinol dehydrogenase [Methanothermobacter thermautotrophicus]MBE2899420.1 histidinol dehydrogenase [Methanothermobacter thermautotrophicus]MCQ8904240.1 histidinol dehydrogenase [Methanothermobacter sp.]
MKITEFDHRRISELVERARLDVDEVIGPVADIISMVREGGDGALRELTQKFDGVTVDNFRVSQEEIDEAHENLDQGVKEALMEAAMNIEEFHRMQMPSDWMSEVRPGVMAGQVVRPLESVGCYIPGGRAVYPSTILMTVIPARIAGVERIVCCTPPAGDGSVPDAVLVAADMAGAHEIHRVGGAQAVAAMAYGTETIRSVDKIVGPGNIFVTAAKKLVYGEVDIDFPAGPSEVLIIADETAIPEYIALEILAQAEHDPQAASVLVTDSRDLALEVKGMVHENIKYMERANIIRESLERYGMIVLTADIDEAVEFSNAYAPEHLVIMTDSPEETLEGIRNAGSIFLGDLSPVAAGDYGSGTNHVLPTSGCARMYSGLSTESFIKKPTVQRITREGLQNLKGSVLKLAEYEGLQAHAESFRRRLRD